MSTIDQKTKEALSAATISTEALGALDDFSAEFEEIVYRVAAYIAFNRQPGTWPPNIETVDIRQALEAILALEQPSVAVPADVMPVVRQAIESVLQKKWFKPK